MLINVEEYLAENGKNHFREWFNDLSVEYAAKVAAARSRMMAGSLGNILCAVTICGFSRVSRDAM
jgi:hypothetical protein